MCSHRWYARQVDAGCLPSVLWCPSPPAAPPSSPTRRSSDLEYPLDRMWSTGLPDAEAEPYHRRIRAQAEQELHGLRPNAPVIGRSEEHTSELQSRENLVCRLLLEKKKHTKHTYSCSNHTCAC